MSSVASLAGVLASLTLLGLLIWVVGIALLGYVTARPGAIVLAQATGLFVLASLVFVVAVVAVEFLVSGAWIASAGVAREAGRQP